MSIILVLAAALLPTILLWLYIWKKDPQPEPTSWLVKAVVWGMAICIPVAFLEMLIQTMFWGVDREPTTLIGSTMQAFIVAALPEESFKLLALWLILRKCPYFDEHFDGIVYAVCVGLGFAGFENICCLIGGIEDGSWLGISVSRALFTVPAHYFCAILMGYYYSIYYFGIDKSVKAKLMVLVSPILAHGIFDSLLFCMRVDEALSGVLMILFIIFFTKLRKRATMRIESLSKQNVS